MIFPVRIDSRIVAAYELYSQNISGGVDSEKIRKTQEQLAQIQIELIELYRKIGIKSGVIFPDRKAVEVAFGDCSLLEKKIGNSASVGLVDSSNKISLYLCNGNCRGFVLGEPALLPRRCNPESLDPAPQPNPPEYFCRICDCSLGLQ